MPLRLSTGPTLSLHRESLPAAAHKTLSACSCGTRWFVGRFPTVGSACMCPAHAPIYTPPRNCACGHRPLTPCLCLLPPPPLPALSPALPTADVITAFVKVAACLFGSLFWLQILLQGWATQEELDHHAYIFRCEEEKRSVVWSNIFGADGACTGELVAIVLHDYDDKWKTMTFSSEDELLQVLVEMRRGTENITFPSRRSDGDDEVRRGTGAVCESMEMSFKVQAPSSRAHAAHRLLTPNRD